MSELSESQSKCKGRSHGRRWPYLASPCLNRAVTPKGFCRLHDPELILARRKKREAAKDALWEAAQKRGQR